MRKNTDGSVTLCPMCIPYSCCPTLSRDARDGSISISDDFGGKIKIKETQIQKLITDVDEFLSMHGPPVDSKR
jgi:hypothetical protein